MRNLAEYPVCREEVVACLRELAASISRGDDVIGEMRPLLLLNAAAAIHIGESIQTKEDWQNIGLWPEN